MKKIFALLVSLLLISSFALAEDDAVSQENFYVLETFYTEATYLARVENTGSDVLRLDDGSVDFLDAEGNVLFTADYLFMLPGCLNPGESAFLHAFADLPEGVEASAVAATRLHVNFDRGDTYFYVQRIDCTDTRLALDVVGQWWTEDFMYVTVTNNTEEPVFGLELVLVLTDAEGTPLYLTTGSLFSSMALMPGSSLLVQQDISSDFMDLLDAKGVTPAAVEAIAYATVYIND